MTRAKNKPNDRKRARAQELFERGNQLHLSGQSEQAIQSYKQALRNNPRFVQVWNNMGFVLAATGNDHDALACFKKAVKIQDDFPDAHDNLSLLLLNLGQAEQALRHSRKAIKLRPDSANFQNNHGAILLTLGEKEAAMHYFKEALELDTGLIDAHHNFALLNQYKEGEPHLQTLEFLTQSTDQQVKMRACFALSKAHDDMANIDQSFNYLAQANRLQKQLLNFDLQFDQKVMELIRNMFNHEVNQLAHGAQPTPLLIVGMPRSGTSLVEQIMASHSEVYGAGELGALQSAVKPILIQRLNQKSTDSPSKNELEKIHKTYRASLAQYPGSAKLIIDKMPLNFRFLGFFLAAFPDSRIIHLERSPIATCWSNYKHYFPQPGLAFSNSLDDLTAYYDLCKDMMDFWSTKFQDRIYHLKYETLTENQEEETRKLLMFCGLEWQESCLNFHQTNRMVKTASANQVRQPMYKGSSESWRRYEPHLKTLIHHFT